jgi:hypothetical protein
MLEKIVAKHGIILLGPDGAEEELRETQIKLVKAQKEIALLETQIQNLKNQNVLLMEENNLLRQTIYQMQSNNNDSYESISRGGVNLRQTKIAVTTKYPSHGNCAHTNIRKHIHDTDKTYHMWI